jgi:hypothetical protein
MDRTQSTSHSGAPSVEATLLARLGLPAGASSQDVEAAHDRLVEFLEGTPSDLRGWARQQIGLIDEAYALLSDPTIDRSALADSAIATAAATPALAIAATPVAAPIAQGAPVTSPVAPRNDRPLKRLAIAAAAIVGVAAILVAGFNLNGGTGIPPINGSPAPEAAASPSLDPAQVAALMQKIQADPKDIASLQSLADLYYEVGDFKTSGSFLEKIIVIDPKNVTALMALGAAQFNLGNSADAEKQWRAVLAIDPNAVEAHYDLGFMYLSKNPPDVANVKLEWGKVIAIDPNSAVAKTVQQHLASLEGSPAPGASGAPASAAPSPSPAASPSPSGN